MRAISEARPEEAEVTSRYGFGQSAFADGYDGFDNRWHGCEDVNIPETCDRPALCSHEFIANGVAPTIYMLATIDLDNQTSLPTGKIGEIGTDRKLPNEFETIQPSIAKFRPKFCFGLIIRLPKAACALCCFRFWAAHFIVVLVNGPSP